MNKKIILLESLILSGLCLGIINPVSAGFQEHYSAGQQHFFDSRYSSAIDEFKKALMINFLDNSARIGLTNSYLARATYFANSESDYKSASDDFRCAIFYMKYYVDKDIAMNSLPAISNAYSSLQYCLKQYGADTTPEGHLRLAQELNACGNFAASMFEYEQIVNNDKYRKEALVQIASMMKSINNLTKSVEYYRAATEYAPNDIQIRMRYAAVLDKMGNSVAASEQYNFVLSHSDDFPDILYDLERVYQRKLQESPNNAELLADLGAIKQRQGKYAEAYGYYKQSQLKPSKNEETALNTQINMGTLLQVQGNYDKAIEIYKGILTTHPQNIQVILYLAQCYEAKEGCSKLALAQYKRLKELRPDSTDYDNKISQLTRAAMTPEDIFTYVKSVINPDKSFVDELYEYAIKMHEKKDYNTAIRYYSAVKKVDEQREGVYENIVICYAQQKDYVNAQKVIEEGLSKFPQNKNLLKLSKEVKEDSIAEVLMNAYNAYNSKNYDKAIELYASIKPETTDSLLGIASSYQEIKKIDKALEYYLKAFDISPNNSDIAYSIGALYVNTEKYNDAKKYFQKALQLNQGNTNAKEALLDMENVISQNYVQDAVKLIEIQKPNDALSVLNKAIEENPKNADAYFYRASVYDGMNKYQQAVNDYKKSLQYNNTQNIVHYLIAIDYDNLNNIPAAIEYYKKFLAVYKTDDEYSQYVKARIPELEASLKTKVKTKK